MAQELTYNVNLSSWILRLYWLVAVILTGLGIGVIVSMNLGTMIEIYVGALFALMVLLLLIVIAEAQHMKFTVNDKEVRIRGVFVRKRIPFEQIQRIEKSAIPFGFQLFGASFLGGFYYLPGIGKSWITMGNFNDGILISTKKQKHFVITPAKPYQFIETVVTRQSKRR